ncbi:MAG TPA: hypothetical protein VIV12_12475 [Streptosporangiaceae bacterium]
MVATLHAEGATIPQDWDWLVAEAQRQRARADHAEAEVIRLRGRLAELEWAGTTCWGNGNGGEDSWEEESCPACGGTQEEGHRPAATYTDPDGKPYTYPGCWLGKLLGR